MRIIFTLSFLIVTIISSAQDSIQPPRLIQPLSGKPAGLTVYNTKGKGLYIYCGPYKPKGKGALIIVDGEHVKSNYLNYLNPNDIVDVKIYHHDTSFSIFGIDGIYRAITIITKKYIADKKKAEASRPPQHLTIFPNPAPRNSTITIQFNQDQLTANGQRLMAPEIRILTSVGNVVYISKTETLKNFNQIRLDPRWVPGLYFIQLYEKGKLTASGKVVITN